MKKKKEYEKARDKLSAYKRKINPKKETAEKTAIKLKIIKILNLFLKTLL